jgi:4-diphosphocytidyl-2-C-methyl-D-erythritol kinase
MSAGFERFPAPAKLNLFLHVVGRRADGYHLLQTVFRFIDRSDEIRIRVRQDSIVQRLNDVAGVAPDSDLSVRAGKLLQERTGCGMGADLEVEKRLPIGGGMGGGSSDAATTLIALNRLWGLRLSRSHLARIALELGADVPVFVFGRNARAEGIGERLETVDLQPAWYLVLQPQVAVSTAEIFSAPELTRNSEAITIAAFLRGHGRNDLEPVVCKRYPEVGHYLAWLRQFGKAAMTGSGACVFSEFETESEARRVLGQLPADMHGFVARGLERHPLYSEDAG